MRHFVSHLSPGRGPFPSKFRISVCKTSLIIVLKLLDLDNLVSRLPRGHTSHPSVGLPTRSTSTTPIISNGYPSPLPHNDRRDRPASSPTPPIAAGANTPFSVSNSSIVLAAATDTAIPPPSNDVRLPNPAPPKFSDDRPLDWLYGINDGNNSIIWMDGDCVSISRSSGFQSASEERPEPTFSSPPDSSIVPSPNVIDFWSSATIGITWLFRQILLLFLSELYIYLIFCFINFWPYFLLSGVSCPYMSLVLVMSVSSWKQNSCVSNYFPDQPFVHPRCHVRTWA